MSTFIVSSIVSLFETYKAQFIYTEPSATGASGPLGPKGGQPVLPELVYLLQLLIQMET